MQKGKLVEKIAELIAVRKVPILADVRDESADDLRLVLEPRSRTVEPEILMEHLFRLTELEVRIGFNMNVLDAGQTPRVMDLREVLAAFLDHRHVVLVRRTRHRLERIATRLEVLEGAPSSVSARRPAWASAVTRSAGSVSSSCWRCSSETTRPTAWS